MEIEIDDDLYAEVKLRAEAVEISVQEYIEQAINFAMQAEDLPDAMGPQAVEE